MRILIASQTSASSHPLRPLVNSMGLECDTLDCVSFDNLRLRLTSDPPADLLVVLTAEDQVAALAAVQQGKAARIPVVAVAPPEGESLAPQLTKAGAAGVIEEGRVREGLQAALDQFYRDGTFRRGRGKVIAVTGAQAGSGITTTATSVAFALAASAPNRVVLGELSGEAPELAFGLDLKVKAAHGLGDLIRNWERSDPYMVKQIAAAHPAGLHILAHASEQFEAPVPRAEVMRHLVVLLREMYDHLVLDLGPAVKGGLLEAARLAESVVVVVRPEVPSLRVARLYIRHLMDHEVSRERIRPVANRTGRGTQVSRADAEKVLGLPFAEWVPEDAGTVTGAIDRAQPLIQYYPRATITTTFGRLAKALAATNR
jgi:pilus assembly protein CpaE